MRVGTWNLEGRWSPAHAWFMEQCACDIWLLSIVHDVVELGSGEMVRSEEMGEETSWAAVWSASGLDPHESVHPAVAIGRIGELLACSCVLPWRGAAPFSDDAGDNVVSITKAALDGIREALTAGAGDAIWGGGFNHALHGAEHTGTLKGRKGINVLVGELALQTPTAQLPHSIAGNFATDHIAVPESWDVGGASRMAAKLGGQRLTENDAYVVDCEPAVAATP